MSKYPSSRFKSYKVRKKAQGFTLVELLVAMLISVIVIAVAAWSFTTITNMIKVSEIESERRTELSRAFDFMTYEIRAAKRVNHTATTIANGSSVTVADVVASSGLNLTNLGSYGTLVLYLEIPTLDRPPAICPAGGPNAGSPPPAPTDYDQVVYDIRANLTHWLGPRVITRYGRVPQLDGSINPCSRPVGSDILVDAITDVAPTPTPTCSAPFALSGSGGFYACVYGGLVNLYLRSQVVNLQTQAVDSNALSRPGNNTLAAPGLTGTRQPGDQVRLNWTWTGSIGIDFRLYRSVAGGDPSQVYSGPDLTATVPLAGSPGDQNCYTVIAIAGAYTSDQSNSVCISR
jgi:prepilin-type N-terminal cleavage/methylation domain-containing protein